MTSSYALCAILLCEVLSPSTEDIDRAEKCPICARERVPYVWLLNPLVNTLEALRLDGEGYRLVGVWRGNAKVRVEPFDAIELELEALWTDPEPEPAKQDRGRVPSGSALTDEERTAMVRTSERQQGAHDALASPHARSARPAALPISSTAMGGRSGSGLLGHGGRSAARRKN